MRPKEFQREFVELVSRNAKRSQAFRGHYRDASGLLKAMAQHGSCSAAMHR